MCSWYDSIEDRIGHCWLVEVFIPFCHGELRTDDGGTFFVAVFENLEQDEFDLLCNGLQSEVVEDNKLGFFERIKPFDEVPSVLAMAICSLRRLRLK